LALLSSKKIHVCTNDSKFQLVFPHLTEHFGASGYKNVLRNNAWFYSKIKTNALNPYSCTKSIIDDEKMEEFKGY